jgi:hypothetical protein
LKPSTAARQRPPQGMYIILCMYGFFLKKKYGFWFRFVDELNVGRLHVEVHRREWGRHARWHGMIWLCQSFLAEWASEILSYSILLYLRSRLSGSIRIRHLWAPGF